MTIYNGVRVLTWFAFSIVVIGAVFLDLNRDLWFVSDVSALGLRRIPSFREVSVPPIVFIVPHWGVTLVGAGAFAWLVKRSSREADVGVAVIVGLILGIKLAFGVYLVLKYPDRFSFPGWWFVVWGCWIFLFVLNAFLRQRAIIYSDELPR